MKTRIASLALLLPVLAAPAAADLCTADAVPAATLLLPYFELDPTDPNGVTTVFSINNVAPEPALAHVTLWTDWAVPTLYFDVYLTGYDVQTINLRDIFNGRLPQTAPSNRDPADMISPQGELSQDGAFGDCDLLPPQPPLLPPFIGTDLTLAHRGLSSQLFDGCVAEPLGDDKVRGYVTVDVVSRCALLTPADAGYWQGVAAFRNVLWGTYFVIDPFNNFAQQETLVHIEACDPAVAPAPGSACPLGADRRTFYGRYVADARDQREPLPGTFALSYLNGGAFEGGTRLTVWRDTNRPAAVSGACGGARPSWFPLDVREVVAFDEDENAESLCYGCPNCSPSPYDSPCYVLASQVIGDDDPFPAGYRSDQPFSPFGWMFLDLAMPAQGGAVASQAWVSTFSSASGRYSVATDAFALDSLCDPNAGSGDLLNP
jgi:hypothetical protein